MKKITLSILMIIVSCMLCSCGSDKATLKEEQIKSICELTTLKCYYNNVAKSDKEKGTGIAHAFEKARKFWIEYEGMASIGIDMNKVSMKVDNDNVVIRMPHAEVTDVAIVTETLNEDSYIISKDGFVNKNKITVQDQQDAIAAAQEEMKKSLYDNKGLFERAEREAKNIIESYVNEIGKLSGKKYKIIWKSI